MLSQHERIQTLCEQLKVQAIQGCYTDLAETAAASETSYIDYLEEILKAENAMRQGRSRHTLAKLAGFPAIKTLEEYDFDLPPVLLASGRLICQAWRSWSGRRM